MKLRKLTLSNFRCFNSLEIDFARRLNIFTGMNDVGKSSILDAVVALLSGTCRGAETGRGLSELRKLGSKKKWSLVGQIEVAGEVHTIKRTEDDGPKSKVQAAVSDVLHASSEQLRLALSFSEMLRLSPADAQRLIMGLTPASVKLTSAERAALDISGEEVPETLTTTEIQAAYQEVYNARRELSRAVERIKAARQAAPAPVAPLDRPALEAELNGLLRENAELELEARTGSATLARVQSEHARALRLLRDATKGIEELDLAYPPGSLAAHESNLEIAHGKAKQLKEELAAAERRVIKADELVAETRGYLRARQAAREQLEVAGAGECALCGEPLDAKRLAKRKKDLDAAVSQLNGVLERALESQRRENAAMQGARKALATADGEILASQRAISHAATARDRREELASRLEEFTADEALAARALEEAKATTELLPAMQERMKEIAARVDEIRQLLSRPVISYEPSAADEELVARHAALDKACLILGPDGIRTRATGGFQKLQDEANGVLSALGMALDLSSFLRLDGDPLVRAYPDGPMVPMRLLSRNAQIRSSFAFQLAVSLVLGIDVVTVDDLDSLDIDNLDALVSTMTTFQGVQIIGAKLAKGSEESTVAAAEAWNEQSTQDRMFVVLRDGAVVGGEGARA